MRYAIAIVLLCGSASADWNPFEEPGSWQAWASAELDRQRNVSSKPANVSASAERVDGVTVCPCGERCECPDCTCPDCPHRKPPHLVATLWQSGCVHGENWYANAYPELLAKGWRIEVRRVPSDSGVACPTFTMGGRTWNGYTGKASHFAALRPVESVRVTHDARPHDARPHDAAKPVQTLPPPMVLRGDYHVHVCRRCGHSWSHHDSNAGKAAPHRCAACGNYEYSIRSHSGYAPASLPVYTRQVAPCVGGRCP